MPIREPYARTRNAPQRIIIDFICMVANIDERITIIEGLQGENKMQWEQVVIEKYRPFM